MKLKSNKTKTKFEKFGKKVTLDRSLLGQIKGGKVGPGWIATLSADCSPCRYSCWDIRHILGC